MPPVGTEFKFGLNRCKIVRVWWPRVIMRHGRDGYFYEAFRASGVLVRVDCWHGQRWYHLLDDMKPYLPVPWAGGI